MEAIAETDSAFWRPSRQPNNGFHGEGEGREDPLGKIFIVIIIGFLFVCLILSWHFWVEVCLGFQFNLTDQHVCFYANTMQFD